MPTAPSSTTPASMAFVADLGLDRVKVFDFDQKTGKLDAGRRPGHAAGHRVRDTSPSRRRQCVYVCGELDSTVNLITYDLKGGGNKVVQSLSTLPEAGEGQLDGRVHPVARTGSSCTSPIAGTTTSRCSRSGSDHMLTAAGHITGDIKTPRNFNIDPSGKWMLIASQDGGKVGVWELDRATGMGKETGMTAKVDKCVCVKFVPVAK